MIGLLCATSEELAALREVLHLPGSGEAHGPTRIWAGDGVALAQCGIGKVNAAAATTLLLDRFKAQALVFSGVAGGLDPHLPIGTVLLADRLAIHDYGVLAGGALTPTRSGFIPIGAPRLAGPEPVSDAVRAVLLRLAKAVRGDVTGEVRLGGVITGDYFLNCGETRTALHATFGACAIDMESGAVAQVAEAWGVPLYVIRTLSDLAGEESHVTYGEMALMAARNSAACVQVLLPMLRADP